MSSQLSVEPTVSFRDCSTRTQALIEEIQAVHPEWTITLSDRAGTTFPAVKLSMRDEESGVEHAAIVEPYAFGPDSSIDDFLVCTWSWMPEEKPVESMEYIATIDAIRVGDELFSGQARAVLLARAALLDLL